MKHRGKHSSDIKNFSPKAVSKIREAVQDLSYLYERGYSEKSAVEIVGNRYQLNTRQRKALSRISCSTSETLERQQKKLAAKNLKGKEILIDGYNLLILLEAALSGAYIFECLDGCYRDIASVHGSYKKVEETIPALHLVGKTLQELEIKEAIWYFDTPVSNSGRLKTLLYELAEQFGYKWHIHLVYNPDKMLVELNKTTITSDGWIIDNVTSWFDLGNYIIDTKIQEADILHFFLKKTPDLLVG